MIESLPGLILSSVLWLVQHSIRFVTLVSMYSGETVAFGNSKVSWRVSLMTAQRSRMEHEAGVVNADSNPVQKKAVVKSLIVDLNFPPSF